jgi:hypothetical protein
MPFLHCYRLIMWSCTRVFRLAIFKFGCWQVRGPCPLPRGTFTLWEHSDVLGAYAAIHVWLFIKFRDHFLQEMKEPWRIVDFLVCFLQEH